MELFLDTASMEEIKRYLDLGLVDGVTTNPALPAAEGGDNLERLHEITSIVPGPVSAEVVETVPERIVGHARKLAKLAENIVVKIAASIAGLAAAHEMKANGTPPIITLNSHATHAVPFIKLGVHDVAVFVGRTEEFAIDNKELTWDSRRAIDGMGSPTKPMTASIRNPDYLIDAIRANAHLITAPPACREKVFGNRTFELTEREFLESCRRLPEDKRKACESFDE